MANTIKIQQGQTYLDIAMQQMGTAADAVDIAILNNGSLSDDLDSGNDIIYNDPDPSFYRIIEAFGDSYGYPASNDFHDFHDDQEGIGFWIIEDDFVVS